MTTAFMVIDSVRTRRPPDSFERSCDNCATASATTVGISFRRDIGAEASRACRVAPLVQLGTPASTRASQ
jgi:hypothetical protein